MKKALEYLLKRERCPEEILDDRGNGRGWCTGPVDSRPTATLAGSFALYRSICGCVGIVAVFYGLFCQKVRPSPTRRPFEKPRQWYRPSSMDAGLGRPPYAISSGGEGNCEEGWDRYQGCW